MPNEILMYTTLLALGMLVFASVSLVMVGVHERVEEEAVELNLESITTKVADVVSSVVETGRMQVHAGASNVHIQVGLDIPETVCSSHYLITVSTVLVNGETHWQLVASVEGFLIEVAIVTELTTSSDSIPTFNGPLHSYAQHPTVTFSFDGTDTTLTLSDT